MLRTLQTTDDFLLREGLEPNPMVFPDSNYTSGSLAEQGDNLELFLHLSSQMAIRLCLYS